MVAGSRGNTEPSATQRASAAKDTSANEIACVEITGAVTFKGGPQCLDHFDEKRSRF